MFNCRQTPITNKRTNPRSGYSQSFGGFCRGHHMSQILDIDAVKWYNYTVSAIVVKGARMAFKGIDFTGQRFGRLTCIRRTGEKTKAGNHFWECLCDCGNITLVNSGNLRTGRVRSCKCLVRLPHGESMFNEIFRSYQSHARERGNEWALARDEFRSIIIRDCVYCGTCPSQGRDRKISNGKFNYNGIDRIDNTKGYIPGNVAPCCRSCNTAKNAMPIDEFYDWIARVYERRDQWRTKP